MASRYSEWTSPRQQDSPPKRQRVKDLREKFEALSDKSGYRKQGTSQERSRGSGAAHHGAGFRQSSSHTAGPSTEYADSLNEAGFGHGSGHKSEYSDSLEEQDQPSFSNVLESTRIDGREGQQPSGDVEPTGMEPEGFQDPIPSAPRGHADPGPSGGASGGFQYPAYPTQPKKADESSKDEGNYYHKWYLDNMEKVKDYDLLYSVILRLCTDYYQDFEIEGHYPANLLARMLEYLVRGLASNSSKGSDGTQSPVSSPGGKFDDIPDDMENINDPEVLRQRQFLIDSHYTQLPYEEEMEDSVFLPDDPETDRSMKKYLKQLKYRHILPTFGPDEDSVDYYNIRHYTTEPYLLEVMERNFYSPPESQPRYPESSRFSESSGGTQSPANRNETFTRGPDEERHSAPSSNRSYSNQEENIHSPRSSRSMGRKGQPSNLNEAFIRRPDEERQSAPSSNRSYSNQYSPRSNRSMGRTGQTANLNETFFYIDSPQQLNRSYSSQEEENIHTPRTDSETQPQDLNRRLGSDDFNRGSDISYDSHVSSPRRSRHSSGYQASSPHSSDSSHGPPRPQLRRRRRALPNIYDPQSTSSASDPSRRPNLNEAEHSSGLISMSNDDRSRRRHTSDPHSIKSSLTSRSSAPRDLDGEEQIETNTMESGSDEPGRRGAGYFVSDIEEHLGTRKLEPKPNTSNARWEAFQDQLREINRQAAQSRSDSYSTTDHTHSSQQEHSHPSQDPDGSAVDVPEDANETGSYRAPSPDIMGRQWAQGDLNEMLRMHASPQHGSRRGSPENVHEQNVDRRASPQQEGMNRRWGPGDFDAQFERMQGEARGSAPSSHRSHSSQEGARMQDETRTPAASTQRSYSIQEDAHAPRTQLGRDRTSPQTMNRRGATSDFDQQLRSSSMGRSGQPVNRNETFIRSPGGERHNVPSSNRTYSSQGDSPRLSSSNRRRGQPANLNETFTRPDEERHSAPSSNRSYSNQEDINSPRSSRSMGRRGQPANLDETFFYVDSPQHRNRSYSSPPQEEENIHSPRTESERQPQDLNRRWGPDDFNQQLERQPQDPDDFNQQPGSSNATNRWDSGCF